MKLIIAEKPELGRDISNALLGTKEEKMDIFQTMNILLHGLLDIC